MPVQISLPLSPSEREKYIYKYKGGGGGGVNTTRRGGGGGGGGGSI